MYAVEETFHYYITHLFQNFSTRIEINFYVSQKTVAELIVHAVCFYLHLVTSLRQGVKVKKPY
jgi:hypothetical protein